MVFNGCFSLRLRLALQINICISCVKGYGRFHCWPIFFFFLCANHWAARQIIAAALDTLNCGARRKHWKKKEERREAFDSIKEWRPVINHKLFTFLPQTSDLYFLQMSKNDFFFTDFVHSIESLSYLPSISYFRLSSFPFLRIFCHSLVNPFGRWPCAPALLAFHF